MESFKVFENQPKTVRFLGTFFARKFKVESSTSLLFGEKNVDIYALFSSENSKLHLQLSSQFGKKERLFAVIFK